MMTMAPTYYIQRADPTDPASALVFYPEKGSDELHDALRLAFPHLCTLQARMRQAVIEFYLAEQEQETLAQLSSPEISDHTSPDYSSFDSMPLFNINDMSFPNTPALSNEISPEIFSFSMSSLPSDMPTLFPTTPVSNEASLSVSPVPSSSQQSAAPTQEQLTTVWALPSRPDAKVHKRRCMTEDEKRAYKKKRLSGACSDCKRRRRKCHHNAEAHLQAQASATPINARHVPQGLLRHVEPQHARGHKPVVLSDQEVLLPPPAALLHGPAFASADLSLPSAPMILQSRRRLATKDRTVKISDRSRPGKDQPLLDTPLHFQSSDQFVQYRNGLPGEAVHSAAAVKKTRRCRTSRHDTSDQLSRYRDSLVMHHRNTVTSAASEERQQTMSELSMAKPAPLSAQRRLQTIGLAQFPTPSHCLPSATRSLQRKQAAVHALSQALATSSRHVMSKLQTTPHIPRQHQSFPQTLIQDVEGLSQHAISATMTALCDMFIPQTSCSGAIGCLPWSETLASHPTTVSVR